MKKSVKIMLSVVALVGIVAVGLILSRRAASVVAPSKTNSKNPDEQAIVSVITNFGHVLKEVSLAAPRETVVQAIKKYYTPFASPTLIEAWTARPDRAPGRAESGLWPDRIEVAIMDRDASDNSYDVQAEVIEITNESASGGGVANKYQVSIKLRKLDGKWTMTGFTQIRPR